MSYRTRIAGIAAGIIVTTSTGAALALPSLHAESSVAASFTAQAKTDLSAAQQTIAQADALVADAHHIVTGAAQQLYADGSGLLLKATGEMSIAAKSDAHLTAAAFPGFLQGSASIVADVQSAARMDPGMIRPIVKSVLDAVNQQLDTAARIGEGTKAEAHATLDASAKGLLAFLSDTADVTGSISGAANAEANGVVSGVSGAVSGLVGTATASVPQLAGQVSGEVNGALSGAVHGDVGVTVTSPPAPQPPTTEPPTTQPPMTQPPTTQPPMTEPPTTEPPTTEPPASPAPEQPATTPLLNLGALLNGLVHAVAGTADPSLSVRVDAASNVGVQTH